MKCLLLSLLMIGCSAPLFASEGIAKPDGAAAAGIAGTPTAAAAMDSAAASAASADGKRAVEGKPALSFEEQQKLRNKGSKFGEIANDTLNDMEIVSAISAGATSALCLASLSFPLKKAK